MLKGEAKTRYMREYMRHWRAGLVTTTPNPKALRRTKPKQQEIPPEPEPVRWTASDKDCLFCYKPASAEHIVIGDGLWRICETCIADATAAIAQHRLGAAASSTTPVPSDRAHHADKER
jgi:hypothetical protein